MTQKNRENMQRAIGIIEGVSWVSDDKTAEALITACEILMAVVDSEKEGG